MSIVKRETTELDKIDDLEGEILEFVRRDVTGLRRRQRNNGDTVADDICLLLQRVSVNSVQEIDRLIDELNMLRDQLQQENERVRREIVAYASLNLAAMQLTRILTKSLVRAPRPR
jgi:hypothetical protein